MDYQLTHLLLILSAVGLNGQFDKNGCDRDCSTATPKTCEYDLAIETYATMSKACHECPSIVEDCYREQCVTANGVKRPVYVVNRQLPGPQIRVCEGDRIVARVINDMSNGESTSIHWHGIHQDGTVYMDGVAMLTQPQIQYGTEFIYNFTASHAGTHYYHSHVGMQRADGFAGAFVVKSPEKTNGVHHDLPEHTLILQGWYNKTGLGQGMLHLYAKGANTPDSFIINGRAVMDVLVDGLPTKNYTVLTVRRGDTYKIRLIGNAVMNCPMKVYFAGHKIKVVASDGADIEPEDTDTIIIAGGERWDILLPANQHVNNYWILIQGLADCQDIKTYAILHYDSAPPVDARNMTNPNNVVIPADAMTVNPFNQGMITSQVKASLKTLSKLRSNLDSPDWLKESRKPDVQEYLLLVMNKINDNVYNVPKLYPCLTSQGNVSDDCTTLAQIDYISGQLPSVPYVSHFGEIEETDFCDVGTMADQSCATKFCQCIYRLKVKVGDVVELVIIDRGLYLNTTNHPMHMHGQYLHVLAVGQQPSMSTSKEEIMELDESGEISRNYERPIRKDTIMIPSGGYAVVRFQATNPGPWMFHCHNSVHVEQGMFMVIQVGESDEWPQNPANATSPVTPWTTTDLCSPNPNSCIIGLSVAFAVACLIIALLVIEACYTHRKLTLAYEKIY